LKGRRVVEIGLGYGTLAQQLLEAGARYTAVDIAHGPAGIVNHRARLLGHAPCAVRGSMLALAIADQSVDCLVSIGCFHHTGSVEQCIREAYRVLKPGGVAIVMVYNQFSYRHWMRWPVATARAWLADQAGRRVATAPVHQRKKYDANAAGLAAPETVFLGAQRLRRMFTGFRSVEISKENNTNMLRVIPRRMLLPALGKRLGLDLYVRAVK
jgi:ubiquinone/menaquinone biosynthesis C-methylase UbiE